MYHYLKFVFHCQDWKRFRWLNYSMNFKFTFFHFLKDTVIRFTWWTFLYKLFYEDFQHQTICHILKRTTNICDHYGTEVSHLVKGMFINIINNQGWFFLICEMSGVVQNQKEKYKTVADRANMYLYKNRGKYSCHGRMSILCCSVIPTACPL